MNQASTAASDECLVHVTAGSVVLEGNVALVEGASGIVLIRARQRQQPA